MCNAVRPLFSDERLLQPCTAAAAAFFPTGLVQCVYRLIPKDCRGLNGENHDDTETTFEVLGPQSQDLNLFAFLQLRHQEIPKDEFTSTVVLGSSYTRLGYLLNTLDVKLGAGALEWSPSGKLRNEGILWGPVYLLGQLSESWTFS